MLKINQSKRRTRILIGVVSGVSVFLICAGLYLLSIVTAPVYMPVLSRPVDIETASVKPRKNHIIIPKISVDVAFNSGDASVLEQGAWWRHPERGTPGETRGNVIMAAHRFEMRPTPQETAKRSPFYHIDKLEVGDEVFVDYEGERHTYNIDEITHVSADAIEIESAIQNRLTLYSCDLSGEATGRVVVYAKIINAHE